ERVRGRRGLGVFDRRMPKSAHRQMSVRRAAGLANELWQTGTPPAARSSSPCRRRSERDGSDNLAKRIAETRPKLGRGGSASGTVDRRDGNQRQELLTRARRLSE